MHLTVAVDGRVNIGPTAMPAFWRENYQGMNNFKLGEFLNISYLETRLFLKNKFNFRKLAVDELSKLSRKNLVTSASALAVGIKVENYKQWGKPGIRAQLLNTRTGALEMDFKYEGDDKSFHVLNAVSPAFTCAIPFARLMIDEVEKLYIN